MMKPARITPSHAHAVAACFGQAASSYDDHARLQQQVGRMLLDKADQHIGGLKQTWLDLGTGTGGVARQLAADHVLALDLALPMLQRAGELGTGSLVCADIMRLPISDSAVEGISANLSLQWCTPFRDCVAELHRVLKPQGQLLATVPLADSFTELLPLIENKLLQANQFHSVSELYACFAQSGWSSVVITPLKIQVHFDSVKALLAHFKQTGAHFRAGRQQGLKGRLWWQQINQQLSEHHTELGFPLTWKIALIEATR